MRKHSARGTSTLFFLGLGVVIGVIVVIFSASFMKWKNQAKAARAVPVAASPSPQPSPTGETASDETASPVAVRVDRVKDPVCGKLVNPNTDLNVKFKAKTFCFCSEECLRTFKDDPFSYVDFQIKLEIKVDPSAAPVRTIEETTGTGDSTEAPPDIALPDATETKAPPPKIEIPNEAPPAIRQPPKEKPSNATPPKTRPTPEEIPLNGGDIAQPKPPKEKPPAIVDKPKPPGGAAQPKPPKKEELKIEEIPLE